MSLPIQHAHPWDLSPAEARQIQEALREKVGVRALPVEQVSAVGGVDAAFTKESIVAAAVVLDLEALEIREQAVVHEPLNFPYIPGLLSFREAPGILTALARLDELPDVLIVDGHGLAHPRRLGLACHLGVLLDLPAIGCAKSVLVGEHAPLGAEVGSTAELIDGDEVVGMAVRTRENVRPVYVSVGHRVDLESAVRLVLACSGGYRLPEPTRRADRLAAEGKKSAG